AVPTNSIVTLGPDPRGLYWLGDRKVQSPRVKPEGDGWWVEGDGRWVEGDGWWVGGDGWWVGEGGGLPAQCGRVLFPARPGGVVFGLGLNPVSAGRAGFPLPEGSVGLEVIHEEFGAPEGGFTVGREGHDLDDRFAGAERAVAVNDRGREQAEAGGGLLDNGGELADGQVGIAFECQGGDRVIGLAAHDAGEGDRRTGAPAGSEKGIGFGAGIEAVGGDTNGHGQPPVMGGKSA